jgi:peptidoglycan/xylan/chitin deacetylase (PgdA/CDA1 family)
VTNGLGAASIATSPQLDPVDLKGSHLTFRARISSSGRLGEVRLRLASGEIGTDYAEATVWREGEDPTILGNTFENQSIPRGAFETTGTVDWTAIDRAQILVTDNGTGFTKLVAASIGAQKTFPRAVVSIAFDDGFASTYDLALPILAARGMPASIYAIAQIVGGVDRVTLSQLHELEDVYGWEVGGHSYYLASHNAPNGFDSLDPQALDEDLDALRDWMDANAFPRRTLAYPKGGGGPPVRARVAEDWCAGRSTPRGPETLPSRDDFTLRGWSVRGDQTGIERAEDGIARAVAQRSWLMLSFHDLVSGPSDDPFAVQDTELAALVDRIGDLRDEGKLRVETVADALGPICAP